MADERAIAQTNEYLNCALMKIGRGVEYFDEVEKAVEGKSLCTGGNWQICLGE